MHSFSAPSSTARTPLGAPPDSTTSEAGTPPRSGVLPFVLGSALLGSIGVFVHQAQASPLTATWFRCAFGWLGLTAWVLLRRQGSALRLSRSTAPWALAASALMLLSWACFFTALQTVPAGVAVVLFHVQPLWVLLLGALWLHEAVDRSHLGAVLLAMAGLALATGLVGPGSGDTTRPAGYWTGVALCLAGAVCTAAVTVIARRLRGIPAGVLAWWQCALGSAVLWVWPLQHGWPAWGASWAWLAGLGLVHTGLAYTLLYGGMARLPTARIAVLQFAYPGVALAIDALWFGQPLGPLQLAGMALMALAMGGAERRRASAPTA